MNPSRVVTIACSLLSLVAGPLRSESPGLLDPTFGTSGGTTVAFNIAAFGYDDCSALAVAPGGAIAAAGVAQIVAGAPPYQAHDFDQGTAMLTAGGAPDTNFSSDGRNTYFFDLGGSRYEEASDVAFDSQGKLVVVGRAVTSSDWSVTVLRVAADGFEDTTFTGNGRIFRSDGVQDSAPSLAIDASDRIVVGTTAGLEADPADRIAFVYRFLATSASDGAALDTSFSTDGIASFSLYELGDVLVQPDGKIIVVLASYLTGLTEVRRLEADGDPDPTYGGGDGIVTFDFGPEFQLDHPIDAAFDPHGGIVVLGYSKEDQFNDVWSVARIDAHGVLDLDYGVAGLATVDFALFGPFSSVAVQSDRSVVVGGIESLGQDYAAVVRLSSTGEPDALFGNTTAEGVALFSYESLSNGSTVGDVEITGDGRILACGRSSDFETGNYNFGVAKLQNDVVFHDGFEWQGLYGESRWSSTAP